eukprot:gnl/MRDRNA2_/MRDRNA2_25803_c0_seq1.p1 gnl/MRDRNA2_/MRDRNA2_25803_c0~~gnl/MRDRNA2_/MRDRNA2_25803_c0_seq1.p1  ORF type:complete len:407 (-),score=67.53 gnl/MRDRNA2_/MRDRNA2_25803_c0_seq1:120-1205(-)
MHALAEFPVALVFEDEKYFDALRLESPAAAYVEFIGCPAPDFCGNLSDAVLTRVVAVVGQPKNVTKLMDLPALRLVQSTHYMYPQLTDVPSQSIVASYMPDWRDVYGVEPIAEFVLAAVFDWNYRLREKSKEFSACAWGPDAPQTCKYTSTLTSHPVLMNQTMGILGYGKIGQAIARRSAALGMRTIATKTHGPFSPPPSPLTWMSDDNDELLRQSDFLALGVPGSVHGIINRTSLALMKRSAVVIPLSAGPEDYDAMYDALVNKTIGGAVLDVWPHGCWSFAGMECGPPYGPSAEPYARSSGQSITELDNVLPLPGMAMRDDNFWNGSVEYVGQNLKSLVLKEPLKGVVRNATAEVTLIV